MAVICGVWAPETSREFQSQTLLTMVAELRKTSLQDVAFSIDDNLSLYCFEHPHILQNCEQDDFCIANDDGSYLFGDARIYNRPYDDQNGIQFHENRQSLDWTAQALQQSENETLSRIEGDFCLGHYRPERQELKFFRDPIGHKSIFYVQTKFGFAFSTIPQPLSTLPEVSQQPEPTGLAVFIALGHAGRGKTCLPKIEEVPSASTLTLKSGGTSSCYRYWVPNKRPLLGSDKELLQGFQDLLKEAVGQRMTKGEAQTATLLSGGLDSSSIACIAASGNPKSSMPAISHILPEDTQADEVDEQVYIESVLAKYSNIDWHPVTVGAKSLHNANRDWHHWICSPNPDAFHNVNQKIDAKAQELGVVRLLDGFGGDFCVSAWGKPVLLEFTLSMRFAQARVEMARLKQRYPASSGWKIVKGRLLLPLLPDWVQSKWANFRGWGRRRVPLLSHQAMADPTIRSRLQENGYCEYEAISLSMYAAEKQQLEHFDLLHLPAMDFFANLHGFQRAYPLLDRRLLGYVLSLPTHLKVTAFHDRALLRHAGEDNLPKAIIERRYKSPFYPQFSRHFNEGHQVINQAIDAASENPIWQQLIENCADSLAVQDMTKEQSIYGLDKMRLYALALYLQFGTND